MVFTTAKEKGNYKHEQQGLITPSTLGERENSRRGTKFSAL